MQYPEEHVGDEFWMIGNRKAKLDFPECVDCVHVWRKMFAVEPGCACDPCIRRITPEDNYKEVPRDSGC